MNCETYCEDGKWFYRVYGRGVKNGGPFGSQEAATIAGEAFIERTKLRKQIESLREVAHEAYAGLMEWHAMHNDETEERDRELLQKISATISGSMG